MKILSQVQKLNSKYISPLLDETTNLENWKNKLIKKLHEVEENLKVLLQTN